VCHITSNEHHIVGNDFVRVIPSRCTNTLSLYSKISYRYTKYITRNVLLLGQALVYVHASLYTSYSCNILLFAVHPGKLSIHACLPQRRLFFPCGKFTYLCPMRKNLCPVRKYLCPFRKMNFTLTTRKNSRNEK